jgi:hydrogenase maturation protease
MTVLLIGIGNTLRRDDAAGLIVVERFAHRSDCQTMLAQQLLPEHADELARFDRVVFVDAATHTELVRFERLAPVVRQPALGHTCDPAWLLGLCAELHDRSPPAWILTVPVFDLGFGEGLSGATRERVAVAIRILSNWLDQGV